MRASSYTLCRRLALLVIAAAPLAALGGEPPENVATRQVRAHVNYLGDDLLEGRGTATRGYELASAYVVAQFRALGLAPAGADQTYRQTVPLLESIRDIDAAKFTIKRAGTEDVVLQSPADFLTRPSGARESAEVSGAVIFVGFGVHAPEHGYSDFEGVDLTGKIAVILPNAPAKLPGTARAHYANGQTKAAELGRRGAVAYLMVGTGNVPVTAPAVAAASAPAGAPAAAAAATPATVAENASAASAAALTPAPTAPPATTGTTPPTPPAPAPGPGAWNGSIATARTPAVSLLGPDNSVPDSPPNILIVAALNPARIDKLFAHSPRSFSELVSASQRSEPQPTELGIEVSLAAGAKTRAFSCHNVLAMMPGSDPALANDYVVVSCHLDHLGIGTAVNGDSIFNGVMDNAAGVASMLAAAQALVTREGKPRRPILFAAVTAEEKGLLGSRHLSRNPPAGMRFAANINLDMGPFFAPLRAVIGYGSEHTTLGGVLDLVAGKLNWSVRPDPTPAQRIFARSDQYSFVREGVPAIFLEPAPESTDPTVDLAALNREFMRSRYHKRSDDLKQPIHYESIGAFAILAAEVIHAAANAETAPAWLPGDFFGERFGRR